jgi:hypothetical protein
MAVMATVKSWGIFFEAIMTSDGLIHEPSDLWAERRYSKASRSASRAFAELSARSSGRRRIPRSSSDGQSSRSIDPMAKLVAVTTAAAFQAHRLFGYFSIRPSQTAFACFAPASPKVQAPRQKRASGSRR